MTVVVNLTKSLVNRYAFTSETKEKMMLFIKE